jgi:hypothetical protein
MSMLHSRREGILDADRWRYSTTPYEKKGGVFSTKHKNSPTPHGEVSDHGMDMHCTSDDLTAKLKSMFLGINIRVPRHAYRGLSSLAIIPDDFQFNNACSDLSPIGRLLKFCHCRVLLFLLWVRIAQLTCERISRLRHFFQPL